MKDRRVSRGPVAAPPIADLDAALAPVRAAVDRGEITLVGLAERSGVPRSTVQRSLAGTVSSARIADVRRLLRAVGLDLVVVERPI